MNFRSERPSLKQDASSSLFYFKIPKWLDEDDRLKLSRAADSANWEEGRQGTGYEKSNIISNKSISFIVDRALEAINNPEQFDAWLIRYPVGSEIPTHIDPNTEGMCHVRLNAVINSGDGGLLKLEDKEVNLKIGDAYVFRPDVIAHSVSAVERKSRLALSVGANIEFDQAQLLGLA